MSRQPRKQRRRTEAESLHERHAQLNATLAQDLREEYGQRRTRVNAGDTVEIMRGDDAGETGDVVDVNLREGAVRVEGVTVARADGEEVPRPLDASNLRIVDLDLADDRRADRLGADESDPRREGEPVPAEPSTEDEEEAESEDEAEGDEPDGAPGAVGEEDESTADGSASDAPADSDADESAEREVDDE